MKKEKYIKVRSYKGNTYYTVQFYYYYDGVKKCYSKSFNSNNYTTQGEALKEACKNRDIMLARLANNDIGSSDKKTLNDLMAEMNEVYQLADGTVRQYEYMYKNYVQNKCGKKFITDITPYDIQKSLNEAVSTVADNSLRRILTLWKRLYHVAKMDGIAVSDKTEMVIMPKSKVIAKTHESRVSDAELRLVINSLQCSASNEAQAYNMDIICHAIMVMRYTGMRPAECFSLERNNIGDYIEVNHSMGTLKGNERVITKTKTDKSVRKIPITEACRKELNEVMEMSANQYIFSAYNGRLMSTSKVAEIIAAHSKKLGLTFRMYDLRHQFATDLLTGGCDMRTLMELMGHTSSEMTLSYPRSDQELKENAIHLVQKSYKTTSEH